jgi:hypothetical protein
MRRASGKLIIAGQYFQIDAPVINFREPPFWDATREFCMPTSSDPNPQCKPGGVPYGNLPRPYSKRYSTRPMLRRYGNNPPLDAVKSVIRQFVIHHDGCNSADMCFSVLQNERGLSCHFLIDNDGTIYQTIDLALMAYHAAEWNTNSIGVELCNRGDAKKEPNYYSSGKWGPKRNVKACRINGSTFLSFDYTEAQYDSLTRLGRAFNAGGVQGGRTMSGGLDNRALEIPKRLFGAARKIENGGSLTILATCLIDTGSRMDQVIFEEFKGTGNMELTLDRNLSNLRIFPALNIPESGTRKEELLLDPKHLGANRRIRRHLIGMSPTQGMKSLLEALSKHKSNESLLNSMQA